MGNICTYVFQTHFTLGEDKASIPVCVMSMTLEAMHDNKEMKGTLPRTDSLV